MSAAGVPCVYCGTRHRRAVDVRRCWEEQSVLPPDEPGPAPPRASVLTAGAPAAVPGAVLGRSVIVAPGQSPPADWGSCDRAGGSLDELEQAWRQRIPLVIELDEKAGAAQDEVEHRPAWSLSPAFAFDGERRAHATFANAADARRGMLRWPLADEAVRLGATAGGPGDVVLPGGTPALCDGGPLEWRDRVGLAAVVPRLAILAGSLAPFGANDTDAALAPDQLAAVRHSGGAARVIAPAGSGKTRVLTERARHLLRGWRLPAPAVMLVAFNRRAADEMRERTPDLPELQIRTLNALGLSLLARSGRVATIDEREVRSILDTLVDLPHRANTDPAAAWIEALSAVRLGLRAPPEVEAEFDGDVEGLAEVLDRYRGVLAARRVVDFDEQVYRAIEILLTDPGARRSARTACRVLLVDEFQDLAPAHLLLLRLLAGPDGAVFAVGDDDQTIYGYSGASPEWLIELRRYFPTAADHPLEVNYRCPVLVVEAVRNLLTHNRHRVPKRIVAAPGRRTDTDGDGGAEPEPTGPVGIARALEVSAGDDPLAATVRHVADLLEGGAAPADVAVLTRVNASLAPVQVALVHRRVPVRPAVDLTYLTRAGVQAALAWLRLAACPPHQLAGSDVVLAARRPSRALSPKVVGWMSEQSSLAGLRRLAGRLQARDGEKVSRFVSDLEAVRRRGSSGTTARVLRAVRDVVGLDRAMEILESGRRRLDRSAQTDDLDALVSLAALHPDPEGFEDWLRRSLQGPGSADGVTLSTIHRVKGREWPHVVLHEVSTGLLPHRLAADVEEERRVFHVGLTRCTSSVRVVAGEPPSPFLAELRAEWRPPRIPDGGHLRRSSRADRSAASRAGGTGGRAGHAGAGAGAGTIRGDDTPQVVAAAAVVERARRALREWRSGRARAERKPPYVFLHDRTIEAIVAAMPPSMEALARVDGIGPAKLEAYGDVLLALVADARDAGCP
ncbi:MAG: ATP-dependent DNA helicase UvrD2 [Acidimicrobiales bacterium]